MNVIERVRSNFQTRQTQWEMAKFSVADKGLEVNFRNVFREYRQLKKTLADDSSQEAVTFHKKLSEYIKHGGFDFNGDKFKFSETKFNRAKQRINEEKYHSKWENVGEIASQQKERLENYRQNYAKLDSQLESLRTARDCAIETLKAQASNMSRGGFERAGVEHKMEEISKKYDAIYERINVQKNSFNELCNDCNAVAGTIDALIKTSPRMDESDFRVANEEIYQVFAPLKPRIDSMFESDKKSGIFDELATEIGKLQEDFEKNWKPELQKKLREVQIECNAYGKEIKASRRELRAACDKEKANLEAMKTFIQNQDLDPADKDPSLQAIDQGLADIEKIFSEFVEKFHSFDTAKDSIARLEQATNGAGGNVATLKNEVDNSIAKLRKDIGYQKPITQGHRDYTGDFGLDNEATLNRLYAKLQSQQSGAVSVLGGVPGGVIRKMTPGMQEIVKEWQDLQKLPAQTDLHWDGTNVKISDSL